MSISSEIERIQSAKSDIITAIENKGVTVPTGATIDELPALIDSIPSGGGGGTVHNYGKVTLYDKEYSTIEINGIIWLAENFTEKLPGISINPSGTPSTPALWGYNGTILYNGYAAELIDDDLNTNYSDWRVSDQSDWTNLISFSGGANVAGLVNKTRDYGGIDAFGLSIELLGYRGVGGRFGTGEGDFRTKVSGRGVFFKTSNDVGAPQYWNPISGGTIRLCKDA